MLLVRDLVPLHDDARIVAELDACEILIHYILCLVHHSHLHCSHLGDLLEGFLLAVPNQHIQLIVAANRAEVLLLLLVYG